MSTATNFITLRDSDSGRRSHSGTIVKGAALTNKEVDNNFSNLNISVGDVSNLTTSETSNLVSAVNSIDPIAFAIALG
jgi:hypothetical protein